MARTERRCGWLIRRRIARTSVVKTRVPGAAQRLSARSRRHADGPAFALAVAAVAVSEGEHPIRGTVAEIPTIRWRSSTATFSSRTTSHPCGAREQPTLDDEGQEHDAAQDVAPPGQERRTGRDRTVRADPPAHPELRRSGRARHHIPAQGSAPSVLLTSLLDAGVPRHRTGGAVPRALGDRARLRRNQDPHARRQETIRSKTPQGVSQEIWGIALAYNLVRLEMERAPTS